MARRSPLRLIRNLMLAVILLALIAVGGLWWAVRGSLPALDGVRSLAGVTAAVTVTRDANGVPTVKGTSRVDVARATGFLHGQERFFQMDLMRRRASGELAALVGTAAVPLDEDVRVHRFRAVARRVAARMDGRDKALMDAYVDGVNAGLSALRVRPYEYLLLRSAPEPWTTEDSVLCVLSMFLTLNESRGERERTLAAMYDTLPPALADFLSPRGTEQWDAPIDGGPIAEPPIPGPDVVNLRRASPLPSAIARARVGIGDDDPAASIGSNNWAVDAARSANGFAMVADDMHLEIAVPIIWYRLRIECPDTAGAARAVTGVSLPGTPGIVAGSNGHVAWGFTNTQGDWNDLVTIEPGPTADTYLTPEGPRPFEKVTETIAVKGGAPRTREVVHTIWGPVVDRDLSGRARAYRWIAHDPDAVNLGLVGVEDANTVDEAIAVMHRAGVPPQNALIADTTGRIAWTIAGRIPKRVGGDGRLPASWADGTHRWDGWVASTEAPKVVDPPAGRLWTANARVVSGAMLATVGEGNYPLGARAQQIRDDLFAKEQLSAADLMDIQLDNRAVFLDRWQQLALAVLDDAAVARDARLAETRTLVMNWGGRASTDSVGFRVVKAFRSAVMERAMAPLVAPVLARDPDFRYSRVWQAEGPLWQMVSQRPMHLLDPRYPSWPALFIEAMTSVVNDLTANGRTLASRTWGERNAARIQHPLSRSVPALAKYLDMPADPLPGDDNMPRVHTPTHGASERFVVPPGHEELGYFHMPSGQSAHPLSPYFRAGHQAWVTGEKTPFLPGPAKYTLVLR